MITFGARLPINGISGKELDLRIYKRIDDEPRRRITKNTQKVPYDNYVIWKFFNPGSLAKQGFGEYEFETRFDGKPWNTHKFEIIPSKKVIAEPLGIFKQRPR